MHFMQVSMDNGSYFAFLQSLLYTHIIVRYTLVEGSKTEWWLPGSHERCTLELAVIAVLRSYHKSKEHERRSRI